jgi:GT2 family glycosyltransferase
VGVALVHWKQPERCAATVAAFRSQTEACTLVIVDNGSSIDDLALLESLGAPLLLLGRNAGFGPAANVGWRWLLEHTDAPYLAVAPHDALPAPDCVSLLVSEMDGRPSAGLACADVGDGHVPVIDPYFGGMTVPSRQREGWEPVDYPHGTLALARRTCIEDIGLFDERYFAYCEEADLGARATRAGWDVGLVHGARVENPTMRSGSAAVDYLMQRNTLRLVRTYSGRYHAGVRLLIALVDLVRGRYGWGGPQFLYAPRGRVLALLDFLRGRDGPPPPTLFEGRDPPRACRE